MDARELKGNVYLPAPPNISVVGTEDDSKKGGAFIYSGGWSKNDVACDAGFQCSHLAQNWAPVVNVGAAAGGYYYKRGANRLVGDQVVALSFAPLSGGFRVTWQGKDTTGSSRSITFILPGDIQGDASAFNQVWRNQPADHWILKRMTTISMMPVTWNTYVCSVAWTNWEALIGGNYQALSTSNLGQVANYFENDSNYTTDLRVRDKGSNYQKETVSIYLTSQVVNPKK